MKLEVKDITKSFGDKQVLHGISFEVQSGRALGLLGRNGAGKTTTIRILMDVFHANSGEVLLDGEKFNQRKHLIGYLPEERGLYPKYSLMDQLMYFASLRGVPKAEAKERAKELLKMVGLEERMKAYPAQLSGGQKQRVAIARAIAAEPPVILADEPTGNLDSASSREILEILKNMHRSGKTVILITHDNGIAAQARRVVRIMDGKIESDTINESFEQEEVL